MEKILLFLSFEDVTSLSLVCKRLSELVQNSGRIWKYLLWKMYPGTSIIEYPKQNSQDDSNEYNLSTLEQNSDEFLEPSSKKLHESIDTSNLSNNEKSTSSSISTATEMIGNRMENSKNYWRRQFGNRYSIGLQAKKWLQR